MTEHLISKSTQIDRLSAERTAVSVQLDDARSRLTTYEKQAKLDRERTLEDMEAGGGSHIKGMANGDTMTGKGKVSSRSSRAVHSVIIIPLRLSTNWLSHCYALSYVARVCCSLWPDVEWCMPSVRWTDWAP